VPETRLTELLLSLLISSKYRVAQKKVEQYILLLVYYCNWDTLKTDVARWHSSWCVLAGASVGLIVCIVYDVSSSADIALPSPRPLFTPLPAIQAVMLSHRQ